jgi:hypothetical protein
MARTLRYRVVEVKVWPRVADIGWEAYLLIHGCGKAIRGTVNCMADLEAALSGGIQRAYVEVTGAQLPPEDGQLPLL